MNCWLAVYCALIDPRESNCRIIARKSQSVLWHRGETSVFWYHAAIEQWFTLRGRLFFAAKCVLVFGGKAFNYCSVFFPAINLLQLSKARVDLFAKMFLAADPQIHLYFLSSVLVGSVYFITTGVACVNEIKSFFAVEYPSGNRFPSSHCVDTAMPIINSSVWLLSHHTGFIAWARCQSMRASYLPFFRVILKDTFSYRSYSRRQQLQSEGKRVIQVTRASWFGPALIISIYISCAYTPRTLTRAELSSVTKERHHLSQMQQQEA